MDFSRDFQAATEAARAERARPGAKESADKQREQAFSERIQELRECLRFSVLELRKHAIPLTPAVELSFPAGEYSNMGVFGFRPRARVTRESWLIGKSLGITPASELVMGISSRSLEYEPPRVATQARNRLARKAFAAYAKLGLSEGDPVLGVPEFWGDPGGLPHADPWDPLTVQEDGTLFGKWRDHTGEVTVAPMLSTIVTLVAERCELSKHV